MGQVHEDFLLTVLANLNPTWHLMACCNGITYLLVLNLVKFRNSLKVAIQFLGKFAACLLFTIEINLLNIC